MGPLSTSKMDVSVVNLQSPLGCRANLLHRLMGANSTILFSSLTVTLHSNSIREQINSSWTISLYRIADTRYRFFQHLVFHLSFKRSLALQYTQKRSKGFKESYRFSIVTHCTKRKTSRPSHRMRHGTMASLNLTILKIIDELRVLCIRSRDPSPSRIRPRSRYPIPTRRW